MEISTRQGKFLCIWLIVYSFSISLCLILLYWPEWDFITLHHLSRTVTVWLSPLNLLPWITCSLLLPCLRLVLIPNSVHLKGGLELNPDVLLMSKCQRIVSNKTNKIYHAWEFFGPLFCQLNTIWTILSGPNINVEFSWRISSPSYLLPGWELFLTSWRQWNHLSTRNFLDLASLQRVSKTLAVLLMPLTLDVMPQ